MVNLLESRFYQQSSLHLFYVGSRGTRALCRLPDVIWTLTTILKWEKRRLRGRINLWGSPYPKFTWCSCWYSLWKLLHTCLLVGELGLETDFRLHMKQVQMQKYALRENGAWRCFKCVTVGLNFFLVANAGTIIEKSQCNFPCFFLFRALT